MWGDKTPGPSHTTHMPLLKSLFPDARFLHVIRDPRDVCLSMQKTFGKSLYRSAEMWRQIVTAARSYGHRLGRDYREVFYELLLQDPAAVMQEICEFIECEYIPAMIELARPAEQYGAARGQTQIVPGNFGKYRVHLSKSQIKRIEQIVLPELRSTPYQPENRVRFRPLPPPVLAMLTLYDTWTTLRFDIKEKGLGEAPGYFYNALKSYLAVLSNSERPSA